MSSPLIIRRPEASGSIEQIAERLIRQAGASGKLPTPIDDLIAASKLAEAVDPEPFVAKFLRRLKKDAKEVFLSGLQKMRGIADLRERAIYLPKDTNGRRRMFAKAHELGHQVVPWHHVNMGYRDDDLSLGHEAQELFDQEANFFAAEVMFQGRRFRGLVRSFAPSFEAARRLADDHGATYHSTLWRYVEEQDEAVAVVPYWPSRYLLDADGQPVLRLGKMVGSPRFLEKFGDVDLPSTVATGHPWVEARTLRDMCTGQNKLDCGPEPVQFQWQAWWNTYSLFVLLRRKPVLSVVGKLLRGSPTP